MEKKIDFIRDGGKIKRQRDIYHHGPKPISIIFHDPHPSSFSLPVPTTFNLTLLTDVQVTVCCVWRLRGRDSPRWWEWTTARRLLILPDRYVEDTTILPDGYVECRPYERLLAIGYLPVPYVALSVTGYRNRTGFGWSGSICGAIGSAFEFDVCDGGFFLSKPGLQFQVNVVQYRYQVSDLRMGCRPVPFLVLNTNNGLGCTPPHGRMRTSVFCTGICGGKLRLK